MKLVTFICILISVARGQTFLLDLSAEPTGGQLQGQVTSPSVPTGQSATLSRAFSASTALSPSGVTTFYGGYDFTYTNNTNASLWGNTVEKVEGLSSPKGITLGAYTITAGNSGSFSTSITGLIYAEGSVPAGSSLIARVLPTSATGSTSALSGSYAPAVRLGGQWYVSSSDAFSFSTIASQTVISAQWSGTFRAFDTSTYSFGSGQTLSMSDADAVGLYFTHSGTTTGAGSYASELFFDRIGYSAIPEPSAVSLGLGLCSAAAYLVLARRQKPPLESCVAQQPPHANPVEQVRK